MFYRNESQTSSVQNRALHSNPQIYSSPQTSPYQQMTSLFTVLVRSKLAVIPDTTFSLLCHLHSVSKSVGSTYRKYLTILAISTPPTLVGHPTVFHIAHFCTGLLGITLLVLQLLLCTLHSIQRGIFEICFTSYYCFSLHSQHNNHTCLSVPLIHQICKALQYARMTLVLYI